MCMCSWLTLTFTSLDFCVLSPGRHLIMSFSSYQPCAPAEVSQRKHPKSALKAKTILLTASTSKVHTMVDTVCPIEIASQRSGSQYNSVLKVQGILLSIGELASTMTANIIFAPSFGRKCNLYCLLGVD